MRFFWDERRIGGLEKKVDRLERKMDDGFAAMRTEFMAVRSEARADFRTLLAIILSMFMAMILGFAGIMITILLQPS
jgi:phage host-nuclease inhibitor protein Gam